MASTTIFHDECPKCKGDLVSSVSRYGLVVAQCLDCGYEPSEEEYRKLCDTLWNSENWRSAKRKER